MQHVSATSAESALPRNMLGRRSTCCGTCFALLVPDLPKPKSRPAGRPPLRTCDARGATTSCNSLVLAKGTHATSRTCVQAHQGVRLRTGGEQEGATRAARAGAPGPVHRARLAGVADGDVREGEEDVALPAVVAHRRVAQARREAALATPTDTVTFAGVGPSGVVLGRLTDSNNMPLLFVTGAWGQALMRHEDLRLQTPTEIADAAPTLAPGTAGLWRGRCKGRRG